MQFNLSEDQQQLRDGVERFVRERYGVEQWRGTARQEPGFRAENWKLMADLGWLAAGVPQAYGGLGLGLRDRSLIMEGLGAGLVLEPYWSTAVLGVELVLAAGNEDQKQQLLPAVAEGSLRLAFAAAEAGCRYDWTASQCRAARGPDGYRLNGRKIAVLDAASAHQLLVLARDDSGALGLFCVPSAAPGIARRDFLTLDERRCSDILFQDVRVDARWRLGAEGDTSAGVQRAIDRAITALAAESAGAMAAVLQATVDYLKTRKQFGRPLSEFQALRHRVADMVMATEQTRSLAAWAAMSGRDDAAAFSRVAAAAKVQAGRAGRFVGESAVQLHGGIGVTDELHVGHYLKRLLAIEYLLGDAAFHLGRFAELDPRFSGEPPCN